MTLSGLGDLCQPGISEINSALVPVHTRGRLRLGTFWACARVNHRTVNVVVVITYGRRSSSEISNVNLAQMTECWFEASVFPATHLECRAFSVASFPRKLAMSDVLQH